VIVNSKEENSEDFCLNYLQEFGLCSASMWLLRKPGSYLGQNKLFLDSSHKNRTLVYMNEYSSYKRFLPQNRGLKRCWAPAHSTCRTGPSCKHFPSTACFVFRAHSKPPKPIVRKQFYPKEGLEKWLRRDSAAAQSTYHICPSYKHFLLDLKLYNKKDNGPLLRLTGAMSRCSREKVILLYVHNRRNWSPLSKYRFSVCTRWTNMG
jgi:hypothetical protein